MPNKPKTPHTSVRIPPALKTAAQTKAATQGRTLTDVIIAGLQDYTKDPPRYVTYVRGCVCWYASGTLSTICPDCAIHGGLQDYTKEEDNT